MVNPGYKQTEIGILPTSWELALLTDKCELLNGLTYTPDNVQDNGLLVLRSSNIQNSQINLGDTVFINCMVDKEKYVKKDDILICVRNGSAALIGKCAKADRDYYATFGAFMAVLRGQNNDFIFQLLQQGNIQKHINKNSDSTINQITNADFKSIVIPWPSEADERETIATALSDIDALITNLEKLIAKKKAIKQGAMQELLTGKRRLPGFMGEWKTETWGDVLACFSSGATPYRGIHSYFEGDIKWVTSGELNHNVVFDTWEHISCEAKDNTSLSMHPPGTFLMAITGLEAAGTRGSCALLGTPATTNQSCMAIYGTHKMSTKFLFHYYSLFGDELALKFCQGTKQQSYTASIVKTLPITYPVDTHEQDEISRILDDMNEEIKELEKKLKKAKSIKSGMMSELLTGRIRLV